VKKQIGMLFSMAEEEETQTRDGNDFTFVSPKKRKKKGDDGVSTLILFGEMAKIFRSEITKELFKKPGSMRDLNAIKLSMNPKDRKGLRARELFSTWEQSTINTFHQLINERNVVCHPINPLINEKKIQDLATFLREKLFLFTASTEGKKFNQRELVKIVKSFQQSGLTWRSSPK